MQISRRTVIITSILVVTALFLYLVQAILAPFVLAIIFAYILSPIVSFSHKKVKIPKSISVIVVYLFFVGLIIAISTEIGLQLARESRELTRETRNLTYILTTGLDNLPVWLSGWLKDAFDAITTSRLFAPNKIWPYFSGALSRIEGVFIFLVAAFYFLNEGDVVFHKFSGVFGFIDKIELGLVLRKINLALNNYLRGQVLLIILMAGISWLGLILLGVKYALIIAIFTGFAEVVPFIGPFIAGAVAVSVAVLDGVGSLGLSPIFEGLVVASMYFLFREIEDIFIIPNVLGRATKLHPLIVLFAVLAGGHLWGILGMILAVPMAAIIRIILEYLLLKIA